MRLALNASQKKLLTARLGREVDYVHVVKASAWVVTDPDIDDVELASVAGLDTVSVPLLTDGRPTVLHLVAWMAHEGMNDNRLAFERDDLPTAAGRITANDALVMDFNHSSAYQGMIEDPKAIGYWHKAEYRFDPRAKGGTGAYGIRMTGTLWSWAFPEYATRLLAEQQRHGKIDFSMAALGRPELHFDSNNQLFETLRDPVFFALSALTVKPGDPDAVGVGMEGEVTDGDLEMMRHTLDVMELQPSRTAAAKEDETMTLEQLQARVAELESQLTACGEARTKAETRVAELEAAVTAAAEKEAAARAELASLAETHVEKTALDEMTTARDSLVRELEETKTKVSALEATLAEKDTKLATFEAEAAERAKAERLAARMKALPRTFLAAFEDKEETEQAEMKAKWATLSDEEWAERFALLTIGHAAPSMLDRSKDGPLATEALGSDDIGGKLASMRRPRR